MILYKQIFVLRGIVSNIENKASNIFIKLLNFLNLLSLRNFNCFSGKIKILLFSIKLDLKDDVEKIRLILKSFIFINNSDLKFDEKKMLFVFTLNTCKINLSKFFIDEYFYLISDKNLASNNQIKLIKNIKKLKDNDLYSLIMLKKLSYALGLYKLSYYLRLYLERIVLNSKDKDKKNLILKLNVSLFADKKNIFLKTANLLEKNLFFNRVCKIFNPKECYSVFFDNNKFSQNSNLNKKDLEFMKLIKNKKVAIIGPSNSKLYQRDEIDSYDVVIRMNQEREIENSLLDFVGTRTDVNYFGGGLIASRRDKVFNYIKNSEIKFVCLKNEFSINNYSLKNIPARQWFEFPWNFECSHMMVQNILLDLLCFNPAKIKLFNVDFYLGKKKYLSNNYKVGIYSRSPVFDLHDPYVNYRVVKMLYQKKIIEVDPNIDKILNYSNRFYITNLENVNRETAFNLIY